MTDPSLRRRFPAAFPLWLAVVATTLWAVATTGLPAHAAAAVATPSPMVSTPFTVGADGYACYRIPSIISATDPDHPDRSYLLAFAEGRVHNCGDIGDIDLVMKRSTDGGNSWGPLQVLRGDGDTGEFTNIVPAVYLRPSGADPTLPEQRISVMFASNGVTTDASGPHRVYPRSLHVITSDDFGANWNSGTYVDSALNNDKWTWISTAPGHAIELRHGSNRGRLVVAADHQVDPKAKSTDAGMRGVQLYYSDNGGKDWSKGAEYDPQPGQAEVGEPSLAERADGTIYVNARNAEPCSTNLRVAAVTNDSGAGFVTPFTPVPNLVGPPVYGSLLTVSDPDPNGNGGRMLYSGPSRPGSEGGDRQIMSIRSSTDQGATWTNTGTVINTGRTGYSDLTAMPAGRIGMVYEIATNTPHGNVYFTSFTTQQLDDNTHDLTFPHTSDGTGNGNNAVLSGGPTLTTRGSGPAMNFDGADDYARLIGCPASLRLTADFSVAAWIRYTDTSGNDPVVWGYGQDANPQFWLRAQPATGQITASITLPDKGGSSSVSTASAYNDGNWHYVVFRRQAGQLLLSVDAGAAVTHTAPTGELISPSAAFTIYIGARPDLQQHFKGAMDDVRIYNRSLTSTEIAQTMTGATTVPNEQVRLAFTTIW